MPVGKSGGEGSEGAVPVGKSGGGEGSEGAVP
jgi:hypothetical protein